MTEDNSDRQSEIDSLEQAVQQMRHGSSDGDQHDADAPDVVSNPSADEASGSGISLGALLEQLDHVREEVQDLPNQPDPPDHASDFAGVPEDSSSSDDVPIAAGTDEEPVDAAVDEQVEVDDAGDQPSPLSLLFQAATPVLPRRASRPAGPPVALDTDDEAEDLGANSVDAGDAADAGDVADAGDATDADTDDGSDATGDDDPAEGAPKEPDEDDGPRRRRRRGGRGRKRRGSDADSSDDGAEGESESPDTATDDDAGDDDDPESSASSSSSSSRRRRRRRRGSSGSEDSGSDDPPNTVTRVRSSRSNRDEITGVKGSTRLEAKRQRRREGRESARRRPIISEAEFLARRESVDRTMLVREHEGRTQLAVLEDGVLVEHYVARKASASLIGNVYLGKVQNVLPSMEAAFIDIGRGRNAVLYAGEVNWDAAGVDGSQRRIELALKAGDPVVVQVTKDPVGHKGARLTSQVSLPGRYLVYVPGASMTGISRKLPDKERSRLKAILREMVPDDGGTIVRTAAEGASEEELRRDVERLVAEWESIQKRSGAVNAPSVLHSEPDLITKVVRDIFNEDFSKLIVSGDDPWSTVSAYVEQVAPDLVERVERWDEESSDADAGKAKDDIFRAFRVDEQLAKALERKVWLPSGGSLVIDRTEAMTVVDVNTGRFVGSGGNLEETVTKNNLEAAEEIVRQLRLRDVGGIVVIDFIDMVLDTNRDLVLRRMVECLGRDRTKHQVAEVTSLGLVQMTRKRVSQGLIEAFSEPCEHCDGRGVTLFDEPIVNPAQVSSTGRPPANDRSANRSTAERQGGDDAAKAAQDAKEAEQHSRAAADALRVAEAARKAKERAAQPDTPAVEESEPESSGSAVPTQGVVVEEVDSVEVAPVAPAAPAAPAPTKPRGRRRRRATSPAITPGHAEEQDPSPTR